MPDDDAVLEAVAEAVKEEIFGEDGGAIVTVEWADCDSIARAAIDAYLKAMAHG